MTPKGNSLESSNGCQDVTSPILHWEESKETRSGIFIGRPDNENKRNIKFVCLFPNLKDFFFLHQCKLSSFEFQKVFVCLCFSFESFLGIMCHIRSIKRPVNDMKSLRKKFLDEMPNGFIS
jgi:hypothetical protein